MLVPSQSWVDFGPVNPKTYAVQWRRCWSKSRSIQVLDALRLQKLLGEMKPGLLLTQLSFNSVDLDGCCLWKTCSFVLRSKYWIKIRCYELDKYFVAVFAKIPLNLGFPNDSQINSTGKDNTTHQTINLLRSALYTKPKVSNLANFKICGLQVPEVEIHRS